MQQQQQALQFVEAVKEIVRQQFADKDKTVPIVVESVNADGSVNAYVLPDKTTLIRGLINQTRFSFKSGDVGVLYEVGGRLSNSFIIGKSNPRVQDVGWYSLEVTPIVTEGGAYVPPEGKLIDRIEKHEETSTETIYRIYFTDGSYMEFSVPKGAVSSVNGKTGAVLLYLNDFDIKPNTEVWWDSGNSRGTNSSYSLSAIQRGAPPPRQVWISADLFRFVPLRGMENFALFFDENWYDSENISEIMGSYVTASTVGIAGSYNGQILSLYLSDGRIAQSRPLESGVKLSLTETVHLDYIL